MVSTVWPSPQVDLAPLFSLPCLQRITVAPFPMDAKRTRLSTLLRSWPNLEVFDVPWTQDSILSLDDFIGTLHESPVCLQNLSGFRVDCSLERPLPPLATIYPGMKSVNFRIKIPDDPIVERSPLIHYLMTVFPNLHVGGTCTLIWEDVVSQILAYQAGNARSHGDIWNLEDYKMFEASDEMSETVAAARDQSHNINYFLSNRTHR
jgi:hypothetical protein